MITNITCLYVSNDNKTINRHLPYLVVDIKTYFCYWESRKRAVILNPVQYLVTRTTNIYLTSESSISCMLHLWNREYLSYIRRAIHIHHYSWGSRTTNTIEITSKFSGNNLLVAWSFYICFTKWSINSILKREHCMLALRPMLAWSPSSTRPDEYMRKRFRFFFSFFSFFLLKSAR